MTPAKLTEFDPHWITLSGWSSPSPFYIGLSFKCPHCREERCPTCGHTPSARRLAVHFWPPIDPNNVAASFAVPVPGPVHAHRRVSGETFDTLTLAPSIGFEDIGHWHGHITNGECTA